MLITCSRRTRMSRRHQATSTSTSSLSLSSLVTSLFFLALCSTIVPVVDAELQDFDLIVHPSSGSVHYVDFYIRGPGWINLNGLNVTAVSEAIFYDAEDDDDYEDEDEDYDDEDDEENDDEEYDDEDDEDEEEGDEGHDARNKNSYVEDSEEEEDDDDDDEGRGRRQQRRLVESPAISSLMNQNARRKLADSTFFDIVTFQLPDDCANSRKGCDWTTLGVGAKHDDGTLRWCCSDDAVNLGLCAGGQDLYRLIVDTENLKGQRRSVEIAYTGEVSETVQNGKIKAKKSGRYVVIFANCDDSGRDVLVSGTASWKSVHGYLPGELYGFMFFYAALTIVYFVLVLWYGISMHLNVESRIPIEKWILTTIILGLLEMLFKLGDVFVWNEDGYQENWIAIIGIVTGVCKRGLSRCLIVTVALGWGVTRDSLGRKLKWITISGMLYVGVAASRDLMLLLAVEEAQELSERIEEDLFDIYTGLTFVVAAIDVMFIMWILDGLASTMEYLESMNQTRKLKRYLSLRCLFLFSVLFATVWAIFALATAYADGIMREEDAWIVDGALELNYLIVLFGVAVLWRPNPAAKEYAYAMQLPAMADDDDEAVSELELSGGVVPSAMDDYDDDENDDNLTPPSKKNGYRD